MDKGRYAWRCGFVEQIWYDWVGQKSVRLDRLGEVRVGMLTQVGHATAHLKAPSLILS